jgi:hypothetical protein
MKEILVGKTHKHFSPNSPALLLGVSAGHCQTALVDESGMIRTQTREHSRSVMVAVFGSPWAIPTREQ